ncbi:MAG TPA: ATP-binding protein, partial [Allosphingosinicella sp.]|nr:ATP-binding protein [Allosphingosinicella sp.]
MAVVLPVLIFLGLQLAFSARDERAAAELDARTMSERIIAEADATLQRTLAMLDAFAVGPAVATGDWAALHARLRRVQPAEQFWKTAQLTDLATGETIFDLRQPYGAPVPDGGFAAPRRPSWPAKAFVGGMGGVRPDCPCALVHRVLRRNGRPAFVLTIALDPSPFYRILDEHTGEGRVSAIVDRDGKFVARSLEHSHRVGTPATRYVRDAIAAAPAGIYKGRTYEGFENYTAFSTSPLSGWSSHIAFRPGLLDSPRWRSLAAVGLAALASLMLALTLVWFTLRQLAEGRRVQERLQEAQKMEALGHITGGIAHDFNNLMTPILGGLDMLSREPQLSARARRLVEGALGSARKAVKLTGQLLAFSRRQKMEMRPVALRRLFDELKPLLQQSAGSGIRIETEVADDALCVLTDANQLELAILNLVLNARDAMPDGGLVRISAGAEPPRGHIERSVAIAVRDSGSGMPPEVVRRATQPFFTTKPPGSGTGLGLAQVYGTVEQSGGSLDIESEPGRGTTVILRLPGCDPAPAPVSPATDDEKVCEARGERIVLCDDDDEVRSFVARALDEAGYVVETVSDGRTAIEAVRHVPASLLLVDFAMHGLSGAEVIKAIRQFRPDLPVLLFTGYSDTDALAEAGEDIAVLRKPCAVDALLTAVRRTVG